MVSVGTFTLQFLIHGHILKDVDYYLIIMAHVVKMQQRKLEYFYFLSVDSGSIDYFYQYSLITRSADI